MDGEFTSWESFVLFLNENKIRNIGFDVRGTLLNPQRKNILAKICSDLGFTATNLLQDLDHQAAKATKEKYLNEHQVTDWTLVTALEFRDLLQRHGFMLNNIQFEKLFSTLLDHYTENSTRLISDLNISKLFKQIKCEGIQIFILADGRMEREKYMFEKIFPLSSSFIDGYHTSSESKNNKLSTEYFRDFISNNNLSAENCLVIGDRYDKDVAPPRKVGMKALLVGSQKMFGIGSIPNLDKLVCSDTEENCIGAVFGRFQPFHNEHLRFVLNAARRSKKLIIGITNPFPNTCIEKFDEERASIEKNPYPYRLREELILNALSKYKGLNVEIVAAPLEKNSLADIISLDTVVYTTVHDEWGKTKEDFFSQLSFHVNRLTLGEKEISGTAIRKLIRSRSTDWETLCPFDTSKYKKMLYSLTGPE